jgi:hypothetical protein
MIAVIKCTTNKGVQADPTNRIKNMFVQATVIIPEVALAIILECP